MPTIRSHVLEAAAAFLGAEQTIPTGTSEIEFWGTDLVVATADVEIFVRLTDPQANVNVTRRIQAGQTFVKRFVGRGGPRSWTYNIRATGGTPIGNVVIT